MKPLNLSIFIAGTLLISCHTVTFTKKELDFIGSTSSMLQGATVSLTKTAGASTSEGSYKKFEIEIENLPLDSAKTSGMLLFAGSMPAYIFMKDSVEDKMDFTYVEVVVKTKENEYRTRYTPAQLKLVDSGLKDVSGYDRGIQEVNVDSLTLYSDPVLLAKLPTDTLIEKLRYADSTWGKVEKITSNGFKFENKAGRQYIYFSTSLKRQSVSQNVELWVDPRTNKVAFIDL